MVSLVSEANSLPHSPHLSSFHSDERGTTAPVSLQFHYPAQKSLETLHKSPSRILSDMLGDNLRTPLKRSIALFERESTLNPQLKDERQKILMALELDAENQKMTQFVNQFLTDSKKQAISFSEDKKETSPSPRRASAAIPTLQKLSTSDIVHEFRTPLNNIHGSLTLLQGGAEPINQMRTLGASYRHLKALLKSLRADGTVLKLETKGFTLEELKTNVTDITSHIDEKVALKFVFDSQIYKGSLLGDTTKLTQILVNLVSNAIKFSPKPGTVVISLDKVEENSEMVKIRFGVYDEGPGIPLAKQPLLFNRFTQLDNQPQNSTQTASSGVGLALSQDYVKYMGGEGIQINSNPERRPGTLFHFELALEKNLAPISLEEAPLLTRTDITSPEPGFRILVADDHKATRKIFQKTYELDKSQEIYTVDYADDGLAAVNAFNEKAYQVCVFDMHMPRMDGFSAARKIMQIAQSRKFPFPHVIFCSGSNADEYMNPLKDSADPIDLALVKALKEDFHVKPIPFKKIVEKTVVAGKSLVPATPSLGIRRLG